MFRPVRSLTRACIAYRYVELKVKLLPNGSSFYKASISFVTLARIIYSFIALTTLFTGVARALTTVKGISKSSKALTLIISLL